MTGAAWEPRNPDSLCLERFLWITRLYVSAPLFSICLCAPARGCKESPLQVAHESPRLEAIGYTAQSPFPFSVFLLGSVSPHSSKLGPFEEVLP